MLNEELYIGLKHRRATGKVLFWFFYWSCFLFLGIQLI